MKMWIAVPYGVEKSGLIIMMARLAREIIRQGIQTRVLVVGKPYKYGDLPLVSLQSVSELLEELLVNHQHYDVLFWAGFFHNLEDIKAQINQSILLRRIWKKEVFFLWERTGEEEIIPDITLLEELILVGTDGIMCLNHEQEKWLLNHSVPDNIIYPIKPALNIASEYKPLKSRFEKISLRNKLNWDRDKIIILSIGRFVERKRTNWLMKLWIKNSYLALNSNLIFIGSGFNEKDSVEEEIYHLGQNIKGISIIEYIGDESRVDYYRAADIVVLTSVFEGEPSVLVEAMACGLPVLASNIEGHRELIENDKTGLLYKADDETEFIEGLLRLINNDILRKKLGKIARKKVILERDVSVIAKSFVEILKNKNEIEQESG
jgi:glycosyltransferase involved in cell wall biosynthesis